MVYDPSIVVVAQGRKKGYLGDQVYTYDAYNYLVLPVPLPLGCETVEASSEKPALALSVQVTPTVLGELLLQMDDVYVANGAVPRGIYSTLLVDELSNAVVRLLEFLRSPIDTRVLGPQIVREITYHVLRGEHGGALREMVTRHSNFSQIAKVLKRIYMKHPTALDLETLANEANISVSTFHHNFKAVTSTSPLQYVKSIRLHRARIMMAQDGLNACTAAGQVGYESASQFSREFKRFFGSSPSEEAKKVRASQRAQL